MKSGTQVGEIQLPAQAKVKKEKSFIFKINGEQHILEKIGEYYKKDMVVTALGIEDCVFEGKPRKAIKFEVPDRRKPGHTLEFALVIDDVELKPLTH